MEELICQINNERKYYYGLLKFTIRNLKYAEEFTEGLTSLELVEARFINLTKSLSISCLKPLLDSITKKPLTISINNLDQSGVLKAVKKTMSAEKKAISDYLNFVSKA